MIKSLMVLLLFIAVSFALAGQGFNDNLTIHKVWKLVKIERLGKTGMGEIDEGLRILNFKHSQFLVFEGKQNSQPDSLSYKIEDGIITFSKTGIKKEENNDFDYVPYFRIHSLKENKLELILVGKNETKSIEVLKLIYKPEDSRKL